MNRRALILGSGVCGLAIALRLRELDPQMDIRLLESEERVGGLARSLTVDGLVADMGPHRIHTELPDVQEFLDDIAGPDMVRVERKSRMWLRGSWIDYPPNPVEILRVLGPGSIARAGASWMREKLRRDEGTDSFENVMVRAFGSELYRLIVLDYTRKVWKIDPRKIHGDIARVRVSAGGLDRMAKRVLGAEKEGEETALKRFYYIPGGVEQLVVKMRDRLTASRAVIETKRRVTHLTRRAAGHWTVTAARPDGSEARYDADLVFSTIPVTDLLEMLLPRRPDEAVAAARDGMAFIANFLVCVVVDRPSVTDCQWLYFPGPDTIFNRGYEPANFSESMGAPHKSMIILEITCREGDKVWNATDQQLVRKTLQGLEKTGLVHRDDVLSTHVHRIPKTYPLYDLDYRKRLALVWRYLSGFPGLVSVGRQGLFLHNNMDHSIHMGFRAATVALLENPANPGKAFYREVRRFQKFRIVD